jgi:hypothetical protein
MTVTALRPGLVDDDKAATLRARNSTRVDQIASVQPVSGASGHLLLERSR